MATEGSPAKAAAGCPPPVSQRFEDINFGVDSAELTDFAQQSLDRTAAAIRDFLARHPQAVVELMGHTDSDGNAEYNLRLGLRRAFRVRDYLIAQGVDADSIRLDSRGQRKPLAGNSDPVDKLVNRRVEIRAVSGTP